MDHPHIGFAFLLMADADHAETGNTHASYNESAQAWLSALPVGCSLPPP